MADYISRYSGETIDDAVALALTADQLKVGYYYNNAFYTTSAHTTLIPAESKNLYIDLTDTNAHKVYHCDGTNYYMLGGGSSGGDNIVQGYYYNGQFYEEAAHTTLITPDVKNLYIDITTATSYQAYSYNGTNYVLCGSNLSNYYTKTETDGLLNNKADKNTTYTKTETDGLLNNKQDELTDENGTTITDSDTVSGVDLTTNKVIKRTFTQIWNWIISKLSTAITSGSTNAQIPSSKAVYNLFDGKRLYQHVFGIKYTNLIGFYGMFYIFTANDTPFTYDTLAKWLFDNGFTGENAQYPMCSGSDDFVNRYASDTSGGSNTKQFTATGPTIGICSSDGSTITYYYNRVSYRNLSKTQGTGTWIQNVGILRIL